MKTDKPLVVRSEESIPYKNGTDLSHGPLGWFTSEAASARVAHVLATAFFFGHESDSITFGHQPGIIKGDASLPGLKLAYLRLSINDAEFVPAPE